jgi:hypothetical protein
MLVVVVAMGVVVEVVMVAVVILGNTRGAEAASHTPDVGGYQSCRETACLLQTSVQTPRGQRECSCS